jgi:hypothetical protein
MSRKKKQRSALELRASSKWAIFSLMGWTGETGSASKGCTIQFCPIQSDSVSYFVTGPRAIGNAKTNEI